MRALRGGQICTVPSAVFLRVLRVKAFRHQSLGELAYADRTQGPLAKPTWPFRPRAESGEEQASQGPGTGGGHEGKRDEIRRGLASSWQ